MSRFRRVQIDPDELPHYDSEPADNAVEETMLSPSDDQDPFQPDYLDVPSRPLLLKILNKHGDRKVLFADKVLKFTGAGKMKRLILLITDCALYIVDPYTYVLKRRIALAVVKKLCMSELNDNVFGIIIPTEYDLLIASTRKTEIVNVLVGATKSAPDYQLDVLLSNRFEYHAAADLLKEVHFEDIEGGVKTRIMPK